MYRQCVKYYFLLFFLFLLGGFLSLKLQASVTNLSLSQLTVEDGLSQGTVSSIIQDKTGFIWIGTEAGLNIYDGYTFKQLQGPEGGFEQLEIKVYLQDNDGLLWFNAFDKGVYHYNLESNQYQLVIPQIDLGKNEYVTHVLEDSEKTVWISTLRDLYRYDKISQSAQKIADLSGELNGNNAIILLSDHNDYIFIGTTKGIFVYHKKQNKWRELPPILMSKNVNSASNKTEIYTLHVHENDLYIGTYANVIRLDISNLDDYFDEKVFLPDYVKLAEGIAAWQFYEYKNNLYVASNQGLSVINYQQKRLDYLFGFSDVDENVSDNIIRTIHVDNKGMFWLGTSASGLYQWKPLNKLVTNYRYKRNSTSSLSFNEARKVVPHKQKVNNFWVATANGLNLVNHQNKTIASYLVSTDTKDLYGSSHIFQMEYYDDYTLMLGTYKGVHFFDTRSNTLVNNNFSNKIKTLLDGENITFVLGKDKSIWWATDDGIYLIYLQENTAELVFSPSKDVNYRTIDQSISNLLGFLPDSPVLLFSNADSLWGFNTSTKEATELYTHPRSNISDSTYVDNWVIDKNNTFWMTFVGKGIIGLSLPDFKPKYHYTNANSIIDNNVYGMLTDSQGDMWFSSHKGIFLMDLETHHFRNFTTKHGFASNEFNAGVSSHFLPNDFIFGGVSGVSVFEPLALKKLQKNEDFSVTITHVSALSRALNIPLILTDKPIELAYNDVGIRIDFSTLIYTNTERIRYEYKLLGNDNVQYPLTYDNNITFPFLSSGKHVLEIRAESPVTGKFSEPTRIIFNVSYAPWVSPIAYFSYVILSLFIIGFWLHKRKQQRQILITAHAAVKYRENRLQLALIGSNSEVWDWQAHNNLIFAKRAVEDLNLINFTNSYSLDEHIGLIHPDDRDNFLARWQLFLKKESSNNNFSCTYRLRSHDGKWFWYKDLGKIVEISFDGSPYRVTGSYTNITESKAAEERALYYGEAFKHTQDWVLIISENFSFVIANQSLCDVFGWENEEFDFSSELFGFSKRKQVLYRRIFLTLKEGEHWRGEELITLESNIEYHVILNITVNRNETNNQLHYICVFTDITAQKIAEKELRYLANYDHLTELPNRSLLLERIQYAMDYSKQKQTSIALLFIDLDRFKQINDSLGHDAGDLLLKEVTVRLVSTLRTNDTVARIGGDEFVVLLENFKGNAQLSQIAQKLITTIANPVTLHSTVVSVGASIGIALYPDDANNSDELLHNADVAMYCSKQLGRNTFQFFTERMNHEVNSRLKVESNLKQAIHNQELINYYQPIVNSTINETIGLELLLRWQHNNELISPLVFIPIAEELGLIIGITEQAIERGLQALVEWRKSNETLFLSVNISPFHFVKDNLLPFVKAQLIKHNLPASALKLEITESALIAEPEKAINTMNALSELGILLALDDFGTGYSSLSYLKQLPLHIIKIDRAFVSGIGEDDTDEAIVDATIVLAKRLNMTCIAEGVETKGQLDYLTERQCYNIQGYLFSRPINEIDVEPYLFKHLIS